MKLLQLFRYDSLSDEIDCKGCNWIAKVVLFLQGLLLGLLLLPVVFKYVVKVWECSLSRAYCEARTCNEIGRSLIFFASLGIILIVIIPLWMQFVQDFNLHPLLWYYFSINI